MYTSLVSLWTVHTQHISSAIYIHCISLQYTWVHIQRFGSQLFAHTLHIFWSNYSLLYSQQSLQNNLYFPVQPQLQSFSSCHLGGGGRCSPAETFTPVCINRSLGWSAAEPLESRFETTSARVLPPWVLSRFSGMGRWRPRRCPAGWEDIGIFLN